MSCQAFRKTLSSVAFKRSTGAPSPASCASEGASSKQDGHQLTKKTTKVGKPEKLPDFAGGKVLMAERSTNAAVGCGAGAGGGNRPL
jgi:hypothetical protein